MDIKTKELVNRTCTSFGNDRYRLMDIVRTVQWENGCIPDDVIDDIAARVSVARVEVESVVSFYSFLSKKQKGKIVIRLCNDIIDKMNGAELIADTFSRELGIGFGETTPDGMITLEHTPCIGMCDQAPAALINEEVFTLLSSDKVREIVAGLKATEDPKKLVKRLGDGNNAHILVKSMVYNNIRRQDAVIFADYKANTGLEKAMAMSPVEVINEVKTARLRGRGGAGFPAGMKWEFTRAAEGKEKLVICNADEGEPGTFKDRVLLTELPDRIFEGMTIAGYAVGAETGLIYLRGEYAYLYNFLQSQLEERRSQGLLGKNILGKNFNFEIRIQLGAGAYICGEETALISSLEGLRGDPKNRPPFPVQHGYKGFPSIVNNVETFVSVLQVLEKGAGWFAELGSHGSSGTKLLSIAGDCQRPGVYEYPFGVTVDTILKESGAEDPIAVQIGGPSGRMISKEQFGGSICYDHLATGGALTIFGSHKNILEVVHAYMDFFVDESCGFCVPCRVGHVLLRDYVGKILKGNGEPDDLALLEKLGQAIKVASRCGFGQTSPNPVLTSLASFRHVYEGLIKKRTDKNVPSFDIRRALADAERIADRHSVLYSN
ncbi:MAG: NADH:ubiquinone oxidoreductase [Spirochaetales bacterium]|nr:MAG: NADH:ubiquinone oxidoreductase [Spirochaetales bacterium]